MRRLFEVSKTILTGLLFILLPLAIFTVITSKTGVLMGIRSLVVLSGSMQPNIPVGAVVFVQKSPNYNLNDVISFQENPQTIVTHRIYQTILKDGQILYRTKGDANNGSDFKLVSEQDILGKEFISVPYIGYLSGILKTLPGFILLIILPTLLFIGSELWNIKIELEKEMAKKFAARSGNFDSPPIGSGFVNIIV